MITLLRFNIFCLFFLLIASCSYISTIRDSEPSEISFSSNIGFDTLNAHIPSGHSFTKIPEKYSDGLFASISDSLFSRGVDDSLKNILIKLMKNRAEGDKVYVLNNAFHSDRFTKLKFTANKHYLKTLENTLLSIYVNRQSESFNPLFKNLKSTLDWNNIILPTLPYPCEGINVPKKASRLPNAPREYRNGIHRGIDFFTNWGTQVRAVADGTVIRADHNFEEVRPEFRKALLKSASNIKRTPSDVFEHILLGKTVILDHGPSLVPGFRVITIYAHLSHINNNIKPGNNISAKELIGKTGNTGMEASTYGKRDGSHLHWEMILQSETGEFYLGQGLYYDELFPLLITLFK